MLRIAAPALAVLLAAPALAADGPSEPRPPRRPVTEVHHGVAVVDPYRYLENGKDPEVAAWSEAQGSAARAFLDALPQSQEVHDQVATIVKALSVSYSRLVGRPSGLFAMKRDPALQQPLLVLLPSADAPDRGRVLVDPNAVDTSGGTTIDFFVPSLDGTKVAVSLSRGGTESGDVHVYEVATGKELEPAIARVHGGTAGGGLAWNAGGTGFWYTRYPREGERPKEELDFYQEVWFHQLGTPASADRPELAAELSRISEVTLDTKRDGKWVIAAVRNGDGGDVAFWLRPTGQGRWQRIADLEDRVVKAAFGEDGAVYLLSRQGAPRGKVLRLALPPAAGRALARARVVVPEGKTALEEVLPARSRLYLAELDGGPSRLRAVGLGGKPIAEVPILPVSSVDEVSLDGRDDLLFSNQSYLASSAWFRYRAASGRVEPTALRTTPAVDASGVEAVRGFATSRDGTRVPVDVLRLKGTKLDGSHPAILYGYGGFGISQTPSFSSIRALWVLNGGVYAFAGIRGGGEYGDAWHLAGNLTHKQNGFDDFAAAAEWLVKEGYTTPDRLGILGGSNGGLLMGAMLTQHPEMFRAVASTAGLYDMIRFETTNNGAFNVTEYGSVKDPEQFKALLGYSPYHAVKDGTPYPAVLITAGENDPRVESWHAKKFAARLREATSSGRPVVLRLSGWGHGMGSSRDERISESADVYTFFFEELGVRFRPVPLGPRPAM